MLKYLALFFIALASFGSLDAVCQKCERVREENARKAKDQNWEFYEDWLDMQDETAEPTSSSSSSTDSDSDS